MFTYMYNVLVQYMVDFVWLQPTTVVTHMYARYTPTQYTVCT